MMHAGKKKRNVWPDRQHPRLQFTAEMTFGLQNNKTKKCHSFVAKD
jgi:hypothetical protein